MAKNHLFSFKNTYGEKMYAIVVGAKSAQDARNYLPEKFRKFEGAIEGIPKSAYDADVFYADRSESNESKAARVLESLKKYKLIPEEGFTRKERDELSRDRYDTEKEAIAAAIAQFQNLNYKKMNEKGRWELKGINNKGYSSTILVWEV